jgi:hypothetical protein
MKENDGRWRPDQAARIISTLTEEIAALRKLNEQLRRIIEECVEQIDALTWRKP